jgi:hypothetical protein
MDIAMSDTDDDARRLFELEQELWRRRCRSSFISISIEALSHRQHAIGRL